MQEGKRARWEAPKYPDLAARWDGGVQSQVGIVQCPGGCINTVEVKPTPRARLEGMLHFGVLHSHRAQQ